MTKGPDGEISMTVTDKQIEEAADKLGLALYNEEMTRRAYNVAIDQKLVLIQLAHKEGESLVQKAMRVSDASKDEWRKFRDEYLNLMIQKRRGA